MLYADRLLEKWKIRFQPWKLPFLTTFLLGLLAHGFALTNKLVNHDEAGSLFFKGATVDSGRWGLECMSWIFPDISMPWIYGLISIALVAVSVCLLVELFHIRSKGLQILLGGLFITYPTFTGTLTYMFTASSYMAAFLLAVAGPYLLCRSKGWGGRILAAACITLSVGIYQSYIAVSAALLVLCLVRQLLDGQTDVKPILLRGASYVALLAVCLGLYWLINQLAMGLTGIEAGVYATSAESQHGILWRIVQAYGAFALSFVTGMNALIPTVFGRILHGVCILVAALRLIGLLRQKGEILPKLLLVGLLCLLPLAMNCMYLIAGSGAIHTLVLYSNACIYVLAVMLLETERPPVGNGLSAVAAVCMTLVILVNTYVANGAYLNLHLRYENNYAMCTSLVTQMQMTPGYREETPVLLAGSFTEPGFYEHFEDIRRITGVHGVSVNAWSNRLFFQYYCGVALPEPEQSAADTVLESAEFAAMPCYPDHGSVAMIDDVLVVKLS